MFKYFEAHTYFGSKSPDRIALANEVAAEQPTSPDLGRQISPFGHVRFMAETPLPMQPAAPSVERLVPTLHSPRHVCTPV